MVAVVVSRDAPRDQLDQVLRGLARQDYPNLDVLVVDVGLEPVTESVRAVLPAARVHRIEAGPAFGAAANTVLDSVAGAAFYVFCHDDAAPEPGAVSALVAAAARWEADLVGPKLVSWGDPRRFTQFGLAVDKVGESLPYVLRDELDQGQHDGLRDVFAVPGAFTLVRASRFAEIGGFDEAITSFGDDLSLSWRARVAGVRVLVTSAARVRHAESCTRPAADASPAQLAARHRIRVLLTSYSARSLVMIVPQALALSLVAAVGGLVTGRPGRAFAVLGAWPWNLRRLASLRDARRQVASFRSVRDRQVRRYQVQGLVGPRLMLRRLGGSGDGRRGPPRAAAVPVRGHMDVDPVAWSPAAVAVVACVAAVVLFGSRHLLTRGVPVVGEMVPAGGAAGDLLDAWWAGWRPVGMGAEGATPALAGALGLLATVLGAQVGLARTVLVVGLVPLGIAGAHRLLAPAGSKRAQVAAAVAYAAVPLPYDALAAGRWSALAAWCAAPWMLGRLARASAAAPFDPDPDRGLVRHPLAQHVVATGAVTALAGILVPQAPVMLVAMGVALAAGSLLAGQLRGILRLLAAAVGGAVVSALLLLPTTIDVLGDRQALDAWLGADRVPEGLRAIDLLALRTGGTALVGIALALLAAAAVPLLVGRRWRLTWAIRGWSLALTAWALVWAHEQGWLTSRRPDAGVVLAPAAAGLALAVGLGLAAVEHDVRGRSWRFGLRRLLVAAGVVALAAATATPLLAAIDGRWGAPSDDFAGLLGFVDDDAAAGPARVLWVGEAALLPGGAGWDLDNRMSYTAATGRAVPAVADLWPATTGDSAAELRSALAAALDGETTRLGGLLAPLGVQYVAVPQRLAPSDDTPLGPAGGPEAELVATLGEQLDLQQVGVDRDLVLYRNTALLPAGDGVPPGATGAAEPVRVGPPGGTSAAARIMVAAQVALWLVALAVALRMRFRPDEPAEPTHHPSHTRSPATARHGSESRRPPVATPEPAAARNGGGGEPTPATPGAGERREGAEARAAPTAVEPRQPVEVVTTPGAGESGGTKPGGRVTASPRAGRS